MKIEKRIEELGYVLPGEAKAAGMYVPVKQLGNALFTAGQIPVKDGALVFSGKVGKDLTLEQAQEAAKICVINMLAALKAYLGDLDKIKNVVKVQAFVSSAPSFDKQHIVVNAASALLCDVFGDCGAHARTAIGTSQLPLDAPVEIEAIFEI